MPHQETKVKMNMENNDNINDGKKKICGECNHFAMNWCWTIGVDRKKDDTCMFSQILSKEVYDDKT